VFWVEAQTFRQEVEGDVRVIKGKPVRLALKTKSSRLPLVDAERDGSRAKAWSRAIVETFIADGAPEEINISAEMKERIMEQSRSPHAIPAFQDAQREVVHMMRLPFQEFVQEQLARNIDAAERAVRYRHGSAYLLVALAASLLLRYLGVDSGLPRWAVFLLTLPMFGAAYHQLVSAKMGVCDHQARLGSALVNGEHVVVCEVAANSHARRARLLFAYFLPLAFASSALFSALPPYPPY